MNSPEPARVRVDLAVDNDVLLKAVLYGLADTFWPRRGSLDRVGILGAARYVVIGALNRRPADAGRAAALLAVDNFLREAETLEPTDDELASAASIERAGQRAGQSLDAGESQLVAMVIARDVPCLETGDKRAIRGLEKLLDQVKGLSAISGKVRCLEQIIQRSSVDEDANGELASAICGRADVDKTLSICFRCFSAPPTGHKLDPAGLQNYIAALRSEAPRVLAP